MPLIVSVFPPSSGMMSISAEGLRREERSRDRHQAAPQEREVTARARAHTQPEDTMRRFVTAAALLTLALPVCADEKDDAAKKLNGSYEVVSVLADGKPDDKK